MAIDEICNRNNCMEVVEKEPCMLCEAMYQQGRTDAIEEFKNKLKEIYPLMYNDFGMEVNANIHNNIDKIAEQLRSRK